jgi:hypothetical protein
MGDASSQLNEELKWLRGPRLHHQEGWTKIVERVETVVKSPELSSFLTILQDHNSSRRSTCRRRSSPFLLAPYLFHIIHALEERWQPERRKRWPALDRPPAELRAHFQEASAKAKALASLLRKAPQPTVRLAPGDNSIGPPFSVFAPIQSPSELATTVTLDCLLDEAATALGAVWTCPGFVESCELGIRVSGLRAFCSPV